MWIVIKWDNMEWSSTNNTIASGQVVGPKTFLGLILCHSYLILWPKFPNIVFWLPIKKLKRVCLGSMWDSLFQYVSVNEITLPYRTLSLLLFLGTAKHQWHHGHTCNYEEITWRWWSWPHNFLTSLTALWFLFIFFVLITHPMDLVISE